MIYYYYYYYYYYYDDDDDNDNEWGDGVSFITTRYYYYHYYRYYYHYYYSYLTFPNDSTALGDLNSTPPVVIEEVRVRRVGRGAAMMIAQGQATTTTSRLRLIHVL